MSRGATRLIWSTQQRDIEETGYFLRNQFEAGQLIKGLTMAVLGTEDPRDLAMKLERIARTTYSFEENAQ